MRRLLLLLALLLIAVPSTADAAGSPAPFYGNVFGNTIPVANILNGPYYATCNGTFDDSATIQSAINAAGQGATLQTPGRVYISGTCAIGATINVSYSNVYIEGIGDGYGGGSPRSALKWVGASGGTLMQFSPTSGKLERGGVRGVMFMSGGSVAAYGLKVLSLEGGDFEDIGFDAFTQWALRIGYVSGQTGTLHTAFKRITWYNYTGNTGGGLWLDGTEVNDFEDLFFGFGYGTAIKVGGGAGSASVETADFNFFSNVHLYSPPGGTGSGGVVTFGESTAAIATGAQTVPVTMSASGALAPNQVVIVGQEVVTAAAGTTSTSLVATFAQAHPSGVTIVAYPAGTSNPYNGIGILMGCGAYSNLFTGVSAGFLNGVYSQGSSTCTGTNTTVAHNNNFHHLDLNDDGLFPPTQEVGSSTQTTDDAGNQIYAGLTPHIDYGGQVVPNKMSGHPFNNVMTFGVPGTGMCPLAWGNDGASGTQITLLCGDGAVLTANGIKGDMFAFAQYGGSNVVTGNVSGDMGATSVHLTGGACVNGVQIGSSYIYSSTGVPACTPPSSAHAMFIRTDGTTGSDLYVYNGTAWNPVAGV